MSPQDRGWGPGWPVDRGDDMVAIHPGGVEFPGGVHHRIADLVALVVLACQHDGFVFVDGWCWGFDNRPVAGTDVASVHSWGLAVDVNAPANPYTSPADRPVGEHAIPDWVGATFGHYGFRWGGPAYGDWMHMEFMGTPAEADRHTRRAREDHGYLLQEDDMPTVEEIADAVWNRQLWLWDPWNRWSEDEGDDMQAWRMLHQCLAYSNEARYGAAALQKQTAALSAAVDKLADAVAAQHPIDPAELKAAVRQAVADSVVDVDVTVHDETPGGG